MAASSINISGFSEVQKALEETQKRLADALVKGVEAAVAVIEEEVSLRTPAGEVTLEGKRHLRDAIIHAIRVDPGFRFVAGSVGFGQEGYRALWVEYGHRMVGHRPDRKLLGQVSAHPFLRPAFEACKDRAIEACSSVIERELKSIYG